MPPLKSIYVKGVSKQRDIYKGACKYYINTLWVDGGSEENAYFAYVVRGVGWGVERQNAYIAYVKDQTSYSPENGF